MYPYFILFSLLWEKVEKHYGKKSTYKKKIENRRNQRKKQKINVKLTITRQYQRTLATTWLQLPPLDQNLPPYLLNKDHCRWNFDNSNSQRINVQISKFEFLWKKWKSIPQFAFTRKLFAKVVVNSCPGFCQVNASHTFAFSSMISISIFLWKIREVARLGL